MIKIQNNELEQVERRLELKHWTVHRSDQTLEMYVTSHSIISNYISLISLVTGSGSSDDSETLKHSFLAPLSPSVCLPNIYGFEVWRMNIFFLLQTPNVLIFLRLPTFVMHSLNNIGRRGQSGKSKEWYQYRYPPHVFPTTVKKEEGEGNSKKGLNDKSLCSVAASRSLR